MTRESLQEYCNKQGLSVKILYVQPIEYNGYEVFYTLDINYIPIDRDYATTDYIIEPEDDALVDNEKDFVAEVKYKYEINE